MRERTTTPPRPTFDAIQSEIAAMLEISDGDLTPEQRQTMDAYLDELADQEASKVDGFAQFVRLESAHVEAMKEESRRLAAKAKTRENRIAFLKARYLAMMQSRGLTKVRGDAYALSVRRCTTVSVTAQVDALPPEYVREKVSREADKTAISEALKSGVDIPGCALVPTYHLNIA